MMFPVDTQTKIITTPASGGTFCPELLPATENPRTILQGVIIATGSDDGQLYIGNQIYLDNERNSGQISLMTPVVSNEAITCIRASNKALQFTISYVPYDISKNASTTNFFINGFSYGEILLSVFVFLIFIILAFKTFWSAIFHKKIIIKDR